MKINNTLRVHALSCKKVSQNPDNLTTNYDSVETAELLRRFRIANILLQNPFSPWIALAWWERVLGRRGTRNRRFIVFWKIRLARYKIRCVCTRIDSRDTYTFRKYVAAFWMEKETRCGTSHEIFRVFIYIYSVSLFIFVSRQIVLS